MIVERYCFCFVASGDAYSSHLFNTRMNRSLHDFFDKEILPTTSNYPSN